MMYVIMALDLLGYPPDHPDVQEAQQQFMNLMVDDERGFFFQPCFSPVWDTAIAAFALGEAGCAPRATRCAARPTGCSRRKSGARATGRVKRPNVEPSGWDFEFANEFYPDIDDTAQVLLALAHAHGVRCRQRSRRARSAPSTGCWHAVEDGGWAAFDVDNNWNFLSNVPFADHNAMLDPDLPGYHRARARRRWCASRRARATIRPIRRGVDYPEAHAGSRWKLVRPLGRGLHLRHVPRAARACRPRAKAIAKPTSCAPANGCARSRTPTAAGAKAAPATTTTPSSPRHSTPSQTAWAILGLIAGGDTTSSSLHKGIEYLLETQRADGSWDEELATGTGFPKVFYLKYHLYRHSFPLLALSQRT